MDIIRDWRFWVGAGILGTLILSNYGAANTLMTTGASFAEHYTQILQGRRAYVS